MILAAGLSPAWQQIVVLDALAVGEVNRAREVHWCASGKVLNVGLALHFLSGAKFHRDPGDTAGTAAQPAVPAASGGERASPAGDTRSPPANPESVGKRPTLPGLAFGSRLNEQSAAARTLALVGGLSGDAIRGEFARLGISSHWVTSQTPTRVCTTILDRGTGATTELVENAGTISVAELEEFRSAYIAEAAEAKVVVMTGSLPAGAPATFYRDLLEKTPGRVVLDTQGEPLLAALERRPFIVKPNREELGRTLGRPLVTTLEVMGAMRELIRRGAQWVVVSHGRHPVLIASEYIVSIAPPDIEVVNPIGSGDCLAAGIAAGLAEGWNVPDAVQYGVAAAAENARHLLPAHLDPHAVAELRGTAAPLIFE